MNDTCKTGYSLAPTVCFSNKQTILQTKGMFTRGGPAADFPHFFGGWVTAEGVALKVCLW